MAQRVAQYYGYNNYRGLRCWEVTHPRHNGAQIVRAASADQALMAAAKLWMEDWKKVEFHSQVKIRERPDIAEKLKD